MSVVIMVVSLVTPHVSQPGDLTCNRKIRKSQYIHRKDEASANDSTIEHSACNNPNVEGSIPSGQLRYGG